MQSRKQNLGEHKQHAKPGVSVFHKAWSLVIGILQVLVSRGVELLSLVRPLIMRVVSIFAYSCCCICFCCARAFTTVTEDEKGRYYKLRERVRVPHQVGEEQYQRVLSNLYKLCFVPERSPDEQTRIEMDPGKWTSIGFQSSEPSKDLRGGGLLALQQLVKLIQQHPKESTEMINLTRRNLFLFACNSIRVTVFLRKYFEFDEDDCMRYLTCSLSRRTRKLKNLAGFIGQDSSGEKVIESELANFWAYDQLHGMLMLSILSEWKTLLRERAELTILQMSLAERAAEAKFIKLIEQRLYPSLEVFRTAFAAQKCSQLCSQDLMRPKAL